MEEIAAKNIRTLLVKSVSPVLKSMREPPDNIEEYKTLYGSLGPYLQMGVVRSRQQSGNKNQQVCFDVKNHFSSPRAKRAGPKGLRAESARAVTGRRNSHRWEGGRLFEPSAGFFYGNSCNSGTESRKIVSKVGN